MTAEHMGMVFSADGIGPSEKHVLLTLCNYTDAHGFCYPGEKRMSDDTGMSIRTVQRAKAKLTDMGLIKSVRRKNRQTGDPISNLTQVNLVKLARMRRKRKNYDDNVMMDSLFTDEEGSDLLTRHSDGYQTGAKSDNTGNGDNRSRHIDGYYPSDCQVGAVNMTANPSEIPKGSLRTPPPPSSSAESDWREEDEEGFSSPAGGNDNDTLEDEFTVSDADRRKALSLLGAVPWPATKKNGLSAKAKKLLVERLSVLAAGGWTEENVRDFISSQVPDWKAVRRPAELVLYVLDEAPEQAAEAFVGGQKAGEDEIDPKLVEARALHARLTAEREQQQVDIRECGDCDSGGYFWPSGKEEVGEPKWHGHNKMSLRIDLNRAGFAMATLEEALKKDDGELWELVKPETPAPSVS